MTGPHSARGFALLGEAGKVVSVSPQRFASVRFHTNGARNSSARTATAGGTVNGADGGLVVVVVLRGAPLEEVDVTYNTFVGKGAPGMQHTKRLQLNSTGWLTAALQ
jgi:hypothetical protein